MSETEISTHRIDHPCHLKVNQYSMTTHPSRVLARNYLAGPIHGQYNSGQPTFMHRTGPDQSPLTLGGVHTTPGSRFAVGLWAVLNPDSPLLWCHWSVGEEYELQHV
ncbi:hypothetical protein Pst134EA_013506 [Puccinia striiformis f. sp. tritici]|uniref:hypothetical protein n=1 Tax=Puccinia striiformis f. sp. tritici TaxID=168172 RepID=UPI0020072E7F|nr:hypothetical protein Pst134EA_013506 [Puccinia striiformis f. sp. tritici]KAH9465624.1 hypothetical protein Pst134EA_013506 [Puccinia striiformis f. sp. tritici]